MSSECKKQQNQEKLMALRAAIDEGDASGIAEGDVFARVRETFAQAGSSTRPRRASAAADGSE